MSIVALAMRLSAVRALENASLVSADRIFDSAILPVDKIASNNPEPFIAISTEDETSRPSGRDLNTGDRMIDLVIEIGIAQVVTLPADDGVEVAVVETDANLELSLAIISRQVTACLFGRGGGAWGDAFRAFTIAIEETQSRRGVPEKGGQRFAARQLVYRVKALAEPPFGEVPAGTPFAKFLAAADGDDALGHTATIIRRAIEGRPIGWPDVVTQAAVDGGYTEDEAAAIGLVPEGGYTGARVGEMVQLRKQDVRREGAHWIINITPEAGRVDFHPEVSRVGA